MGSPVEDSLEGGLGDSLEVLGPVGNRVLGGSLVEVGNLVVGNHLVVEPHIREGALRIHWGEGRLDRTFFKALK